jgi:hypothetical protein
MADGPGSPKFLELETALADLAGHVEYPTPRHLGQEVSAEIRKRPLPGMTSRLRMSMRRMVIVPTTAVLLALAGTLTLFPGARAAVVSWLGLPGVVIHVGTPPSTIGRGLQLGRPTTLSDASRRLFFQPLIPTLPGFHQPDSLYLGGPPPRDGRLSLVYAARNNVPAIPGTRVSVLLTEFRATTDMPLLEKVVADGSQVTRVTVNGGLGFWVHGKAHFVVYNRGDEDFPDKLRLSSNALLWQYGPVTLRLEGSLSEGSMLRLARSCQPVSQ